MVPGKQNRLISQIVIAAFLVAVVFLSGCTSQTQKVYHVGILSGTDAFINVSDGFKSKMTELGYVEGKNIVYDLQKVNNDPAGEKLIAKKFVDDKVDLIFAFPTDAALSARAATQGSSTPVVFDVAIIEGDILVENVRHPGGNITGVRFPGPEMTVKRIEILHELVPQAKRIYVTWDKNYPSISYTVDMLRQTAVSINVTLVEVPVSTGEEIRADLKARSELNDTGIDAILVMPTLLTAFETYGDIAKFGTEHKLAVAGTVDEHADMGAVFSYAPALFEMGELAAPQADKIFKGIPAGTVSVVTPEGHLRLNYKVAQQLGLKVSEGMLSQAGEIIH